MVDFFALLGPARSLALVGLGKNVGKTTALNAIVGQARQAGIPLGLTSIGRDGELVDAITSHAKPPIRVVPGTVLATVEASLPEIEGAFEILETTGERTALGPVVIARALKEAQWELSGPASTRGLAQIRDRLLAHGARMVILDGAFDRRSSAAPTLTDVTIVITGASLDPDMAKVLVDTTHLLDIFQLPAADLSAAEAEVLDERRLAVATASGLRKLDVTTALGSEREVAAQASGCQRLLLGSTFTPQLLDALQGPLEVVLRDPTSALVDAPSLKRFRARGGSLRVWKPIRLPLLVCNPFSPYGWRFDAATFLEAVGRVAAPLPVVDLQLGEVVQCEPVSSS